MPEEQSKIESDSEFTITVAGKKVTIGGNNASSDSQYEKLNSEDKSAGQTSSFRVEDNIDNATKENVNIHAGIASYPEQGSLVIDKVGRIITWTY